MPSLKDATKPPANLAQMVEVQPQNPPAPVLVPREQPGLAVGSLGPAPDAFTTAYDRIRQWFRPGTSQQRFPPLPTKANPQLNAAAASVSKTVAAAAISAISPDNDTPSVNLQTGTSYTVQASDLNTLISITNASGGFIYLPPVAGTNTVAVNNVISTPFNSGNSVPSGSTVTSTYTFTPTVDINVGDYIMWTGRRVLSAGETASITISDSQNGSWTVRYTNQNNPGIGGENNAIGYVQNLTKIPAGSSITITQIATFSGSLFNPDVNGLWSVSGLTGLDQEAVAQTASASTSYSSGGLTLKKNCFLVSSQNSDTGDINPIVPANTQGLAWTSLVGNASFASSYILTANPGAVNDVYTVTGTTARIDRLTSFLTATLSDVLRLQDNFFCYVENKGTGSFQLHSTALIDGSQNNVTLASGQGCLLIYDATSAGWYTMRGIGGSSSSGTVTHTAGALTSGQLIVGNGAADIKVGNLTGDATTSGSTAVSVVKVNGGSIPTSAAFVATNGSNQFTSAAYTPENVTNKDAASGYAGLDSTTHLKVTEQQETVDARTTVSEAVSDSDRGKVVTFSNTSAVAATIAQAGASGLFTTGWWCDLVNLNTGIVTLTPTTSTINGLATLILQKGEGGRLLSDGSNYIFVAGQPTTDSPNDADILTYVLADKRWESKGIGTLGGANASQLRGKSISSATPQNQDVLKWSTADNQYDLVLADGAEHGDTFWWTDPAFVVMRDEFIRYTSGTSQLTGTQATDIGELGWIAVGTGGTGNNGIKQQGGVPPNIGTFTWANTATVNQYIALMLNVAGGDTNLHQNAFALFEQAGWKLTWVFKLDNETGQTTNVVKNLFQKKSMYVGLMGAAMSLVTGTDCARPDIFFGVRFDTSTVPAGMTVTSVANASGGSTVYTGTFGGGTAPGFAGMNITFTGFANAANNGTFACTASTATTLTVSNASGVSESVAPVGSAWAVAASIPSTGTAGAASGGNTVYNLPSGIVGINANQLQGISFVVTGGVASGGANNGTFTCVANTTNTITLNNASGVAETHALFITGGSLNDTVMTLEAVQNMTLATSSDVPVRHNIQGTTVSGPAPDTNWHRLDIYSTTAGQIVIQLDGSNTYKLSYTASSMTFASNGNGLIETTGKQLNISNTVAYTNAMNCGLMTFAAGSVITIGGLTGGPSSINGAYTVEAAISAGPPQFIVPSTFTAGQTIQQSTQTVAGLPAVTPCAIFGNDDTAAPYLTTRFFVDFFALGWNKAISSPSTAPNPADPRYW